MAFSKVLKNKMCMCLYMCPVLGEDAAEEIGSIYMFSKLYSLTLLHNIGASNA